MPGARRLKFNLIPDFWSNDATFPHHVHVDGNPFGLALQGQGRCSAETRVDQRSLARRRGTMSRVWSRCVGFILLAIACQSLPASLGKRRRHRSMASSCRRSGSGLNTPSAIAFAPNGRVFVAERAGIVKTFDSVADANATVAADLRTNVHARRGSGTSRPRSRPRLPRAARTSTCHICSTHPPPRGNCARLRGYNVR